MFSHKVCLNPSLSKFLQKLKPRKDIMEEYISRNECTDINANGHTHAGSQMRIEKSLDEPVPHGVWCFILFL